MFIDEEGNGLLDHITKDTLKTGMRVKTRAHGWFLVMRDVSVLVFGDTDIFVSDDQVSRFSEYDENLNLLDRKYSAYDIIAVTESKSLNDFVRDYHEEEVMDNERIIWVRPGERKIWTPGDIYPIDLKRKLCTGDIVELRNGERHAVIIGQKCKLETGELVKEDVMWKLPDFDSFEFLSFYDRGLRNKNGHKELDIVKIFSRKFDISNMKKSLNSVLFLNPEWERPEKEPETCEEWVKHLAENGMPF